MSRVTEATYVSQLTAQGRGAIATVAIRGSHAESVIAQCFHPIDGVQADALLLQQIYFGLWRPPSSVGDPGEELVVCRAASDCFEVHCHGGSAAVEAIVDALIQLGCRHAPWAAFVSDSGGSHASFACPHGAAWQHDALIGLSEATTERTARILLDQYHGALDREMQQLVQLRSSGLFVQCRRIGQKLLEASSVGLHLTRPWQVVLAGPTNVGKSSLINRLVGYHRAVTFDQPGTTRDVVDVQTALNGWPVQFSDTAGLRETDDPLEQLGVARTRAQLENADLTLVVLSSETLCSSEADYRATIPADRAGLTVVNKCDLGPNRPCPAWLPADAIQVSALTGEGLPDLVETICRRLVPDIPAPGSAVPFRPHQIEAIRNALPDA